MDTIDATPPPRIVTPSAANHTGNSQSVLVQGQTTKEVLVDMIPRNINFNGTTSMMAMPNNHNNHEEESSLSAGHESSTSFRLNDASMTSLQYQASTSSLRAAAPMLDGLHPPPSIQKVTKNSNGSQPSIRLLPLVRPRNQLVRVPSRLVDLPLCTSRRPLQESCHRMRLLRALPSRCATR